MARAFASLMLAFVLVACTSGDRPEACDATSRLRLGDGTEPAELTVEIADSDEERQRGLMERTSLGADRGMVFVFDGPTESGFWMKDTLIPLSIAFWNEERRIVSILDMQPCREEICEIYSPGRPYVGAVEANLGYFDDHDVAVGDQVELITRACA